jgi:hypothetical protein
MFDPARLGIDLLVLQLMFTNWLTRMVEDHAASAGGSLVYSNDEFGHGYSSIYM